MKGTTTVFAELVDMDGLAVLTRVPILYLEKLCKAGKGPKPVKIGPYLRFEKTSINAWIKEMSGEHVGETK